MIHNPSVNKDLQDLGVRFLQDTSGNAIIPFETLTQEDVVIIPAFGTTLEIESKLTALGISIEKYNTTCPFVEKVWNRSEQIANKDYSVIIHGKPTHEETRATFSHASNSAPSLVLNNMQEAELLSNFILGNSPIENFYTVFAGRYSEGFDAEKHLSKIGVVNQTTMLASDTQAIADFLKTTMIEKFGLNNSNVQERFAETRDTLCYATNDNQSAVYGLLQQEADLAIVVGGYNSSNTSHLVELCEEKLPTYYIDHPNRILSKETIEHFNFHKKIELRTTDYLPTRQPVRILMTSGASCPDALVENTIEKIAGYFMPEDEVKTYLQSF